MPAFTLVGCSLLSLMCAVLGNKNMVVSPATAMTSTACDRDDDVLQTCFVCEQLPFGLGLPPEDCCTDRTAFEICQNCIADPTKCLLDYLALVNGDDPYENDKSDQLNNDISDFSDIVDKRFGRLFLGQKPVSRPIVYETPVTEKRAEGFDQSHGNLYKRWGTLNMGSRYGGSFNLGTLWKHYNSPYVIKRDMTANEYQTQNSYDSPNLGNLYKKRYGTLNLGKRYHASDLRKRYGTLNLGKRDDVTNEDKRYGMLYLGKKWGTLGLRKKWGTLGLRKKWGTLGLGKRWGSLGLRKRWGYLGLGNTHHYVPAKRDTSSSGLYDHRDKRYGRLFL